MARLNVNVAPASSRDLIVDRLGEALTIKVMAAPEKGKANDAFPELLATKLGHRRVRWADFRASHPEA